MTLLVKITLVIALILSIIIPFGSFLLGKKTKGRYKVSLGFNCFLFFGTLLLANILMYGGNAFAAGEAASSATGLEIGRAHV